jgi:hypothetical protein
MSDNEEYVKQLEDAIGQMLKPLKNIPFGLVIKSMTGFEVISFDRDKQEDKELLHKISQAAEITAREIVEMGGIKRPRPNEVGNDLEPFMEKALKFIGYADTGTPKGKSGKGKAVGYPDREFTDKGRPVYLELKSYAKETVNSTMRSFYLSPSDDFKVNKTALHLLIAFEIVREGNAFFVSGWKIITVDKLLVDVKYEFNSDNKRLYASHAVLAEQKFDYEKLRLK